MNLNRVLFGVFAILGTLFVSMQADMMFEETISIGLFIYFLVSSLLTTCTHLNYPGIPL